VSNTFDQLYTALKDCQKLLEHVDETLWAQKIGDTTRNYANGKALSLTWIFSWFGGMGSFNDLFLSSYNGHSIPAGEETRLNDSFTALRSTIYELASQLAKETD